MSHPNTTPLQREHGLPLLRLRGLVKRFGGLLVTDHVDLEIPRGEVHAIIGPNGAGKTTLINQITGELRSDQGRVELVGRDVTAWPVHERATGGLSRSYQITSIVPSFTVLENMVLAVQGHQRHNFHFWTPALDQADLVSAADEVLEQLRMTHLRNRRAEVLAYGQQRQLELAMALAIRPQVLLLDEPMAGLGPTETQHMVDVLLAIKSRYAILLVEHDMHAVFSLADVCSVLVNGKVVFRGAPAEVGRSDVVREAYLGDEEIPA